MYLHQAFSPQFNDYFVSVNLQDKLNHLLQVTYAKNRVISHDAPITPLDPEAKLPLDQLCAGVTMFENHKVKERTYQPDPKVRLLTQINGPEDFFHINNKFTRSLYLEGFPGTGKTVFCKQLLRYWCNSKVTNPPFELSEWEKFMANFQFAWYVPMKDMSGEKNLLTDMLCDVFSDHEDCHATLKEVLGKQEYRALILLDGLDQWKADDKMHLRQRGIPDLYGINSYGTVIILALRPWVMQKIRPFVNSDDKVVEFYGLEDEGPAMVTEKVLQNFFRFNDSDVDASAKVEMILMKSLHLRMKSLMTLPFFTTAFVHLWYKTGRVEGSFTYFVLKMMELLMQHSLQDKQFDPDIYKEFNKFKKHKEDLSELNISKFIKDNPMLDKYLFAFLNAGEISYENLVEQESKMTFSKDRLKRDILGVAEHEFLVKCGLINLFKGPVSFHQIKVKVVFTHRLFQEFFAAMYITCGNDSLIAKLLGHCSSIENILTFFNTFKFVSCIDPKLGAKIARHAAKMLSSNADLASYRRTFADDKTSTAVMKIYDLVCSCYRETKLCRSMENSAKQSLHFLVTDVYVSGTKTPTDVIEVSAEILQKCSKDVVSFYLSAIPDTGKDFSSSAVKQFLDSATSLQYLCITDRSISQISSRFTSLSTLSLSFIKLSPEAANQLQSTLHKNDQLKVLHLEGIVISSGSSLDLKITKAKQLSVLTLAFLHTSNVRICPNKLETLRIDLVLGSLQGLLTSLPQCHCLSTLSVCYTKNVEESLLLLTVLPNLGHLQHIAYDGTKQGQSAFEYHGKIVKAILQLPSLRSIELRNIDIVTEIAMSSAPLELSEIKLKAVCMDEACWNSFVSGLLLLPRRLSVTMRYTNIDDETLELVRESPQLNVTEDDGMDSFNFVKFPASLVDSENMEF